MFRSLDASAAAVWVYSGNQYLVPLLQVFEIHPSAFKNHVQTDNNNINNNNNRISTITTTSSRNKSTQVV
jgi:hypothetical protein